MEVGENTQGQPPTKKIDFRSTTTQAEISGEQPKVHSPSSFWSLSFSAFSFVTKALVCSPHLPTPRYISMHLLANVGLLALPLMANGFVPKSVKVPQKLDLRTPIRKNSNHVSVKTSWSEERCSLVQLNMAFQSDKGTTNMWDGPMALTRERDACGVGFIANTNSGGMSSYSLRRIRGILLIAILTHICLV